MAVEIQNSVGRSPYYYLPLAFKTLGTFKNYTLYSAASWNFKR